MNEWNNSPHSPKPAVISDCLPVCVFSVQCPECTLCSQDTQLQTVWSRCSINTRWLIVIRYALGIRASQPVSQSHFLSLWLSSLINNTHTLRELHRREQLKKQKKGYICQGVLGAMEKGKNWCSTKKKAFSAANLLVSPKQQKRKEKRTGKSVWSQGSLGGNCGTGGDQIHLKLPSQ